MISILKFSLLIFLSTISSALLAQNTEWAKIYKPVWETAVSYSVAVAEAMPSDQYNYKPTKENKSFGQQIIHSAYIIDFMIDKLIDDKDVKYNEPKAADMTKEEIIAYLKEKLQKYQLGLSRVSDEDLNKLVTNPFSKRTLPIQMMFHYIHHHSQNHWAKANLYLRLNDINPPKYNY